MTTIKKIANATNQMAGMRKASKLKAVTDGSHYNFEYQICPASGTYDILLESNYEFHGETEKERQSEMLEHFNSLLIEKYFKVVAK